MDIENIVYILLVVAYFIFTAFKQSKKDKNKKTGKEPQRDIFSEIFGEPEEKEPWHGHFEREEEKPPPREKRRPAMKYETLETHVDEEEQYEREKAAAQRLKELQEKAERARADSRKKIKVNKTPIELEEISDEVKIEPLELDMRKAIIYSEILKRPYE